MWVWLRHRGRARRKGEATEPDAAVLCARRMGPHYMDLDAEKIGTRYILKVEWRQLKNVGAKNKRLTMMLGQDTVSP